MARDGSPGDPGASRYRHWCGSQKLPQGVVRSVDVVTFGLFDLVIALAQQINIHSYIGLPPENQRTD